MKELVIGIGLLIAAIGVAVVAIKLLVWAAQDEEECDPKPAPIVDDQGSLARIALNLLKLGKKETHNAIDY